VDRTIAAGVLRPDFDVNDLSFIFEQLSSVRIGRPERSMALRKRYLEMFQQALHTTRRAPDGVVTLARPTWQELGDAGCRKPP